MQESAFITSCSVKFCCTTGGFGGRAERDFDGARDRRRGYGFGDGGYEDDRRGGGGFDDRRRGGGGGFADTYGPDRGRPRDGGFGWALLLMAQYIHHHVCFVLCSSFYNWRPSREVQILIIAVCINNWLVQAAR